MYIVSIYISLLALCKYVSFWLNVMNFVGTGTISPRSKVYIVSKAKPA